jgi:hypothetical protein
MSELSQHAKLIKAIEIAKGAQVGIELSYFDVLEVAGELNEAKEVVAMLNARIAELEAYIDQLIEVGDALESQAYVAWRKYGMLDFPAAETWCALVKDWKEREE